MKKIKSIAMDSFLQIIRYGEYDPTDDVLDEVLEAMLEEESASEILNNAVNGDELLATLRIQQHAMKDLEAQKRADRREAQLLREYAKQALEAYEEESWMIWEEGARPMPGDSYQ